MRFQSTRPIRGATEGGQYDEKRCHISIHAPHTGRDERWAGYVLRADQISIHAPHTGRDGRSLSRRNSPSPISIHAPHTGRDRRPRWPRYSRWPISIHAPHTGRDPEWKAAEEAIFQFQSTRPIRGATEEYGNIVTALSISIHAPHTGRDGCHQLQPCIPQHFNPRAPYGARLVTDICKRNGIKFQSTRPIRGATCGRPA